MTTIAMAIGRRRWKEMPTMLSQQLRRSFAALGARLLVRTDPKAAATRIAIRSDANGPYFELLLPRLARSVVNVLAVEPRHNRLIVRLTHGARRMNLLVRGGPQPSVRAVSPEETRALLAGAELSEVRQAAA